MTAGLFLLVLLAAVMHAAWNALVKVSNDRVAAMCGLAIVGAFWGALLLPFAATPAEAARRPKAETAYDNLVLAGDWTATGLPSTIEGAIRSGQTAARSLRAGSVVRAGTQVRGAA